MSGSPARADRPRSSRRVWRIVLLSAGAVAAALLIALAAVVPLSADAARERVLDVLADRFDGEVELDELSLRVLPSLRAQGSGLVVRHRGRQDVPPLVTIERFSVEGRFFGLLRKHVSRVTLEGLQVAIPPRDGEPEDRREPVRGGWVVDELLSSGASVTIVPRDRAKRPRVWAIHDLRMQSVSFDRAMPFEATVTNAVPPGTVVTSGSFGPWQAADPGLTPLEGAFTFDNADLGVFKGITGILSAEGTYRGQLDRIEVQGDTFTPEFALASVGRPVPLRAQYRTVVDGTNGDTLLERIDASFLDTSLVATGDVIDMPGEPGRRVALDVVMESARIEDVLRLAVKSEKPPMTGALTLDTALEIPPGDRDVVEKLRLDGSFSLTDARFTSPEVQRRIGELSRRGRGRPEAGAAGDVASDFKGSFRMADGTLTIPNVAFDVPGAVVRLAGTYGMVSQEIDFRGTLFMEARVSETVTGIKSLLLKAVDPLFRGENGGSAIPIKVSGQREAPEFGLDAGRVFKR